MSQFKEGGPLDLTGIESINNLDSARLALRWALERIHALEKTNAFLAEKSEREQKSREKAEEESRALNRKVSLHLDFGAERQAYFHRMQEFISLRLAGKPDDKSQALRELELVKQQESLQQSRVDLEREFAAKKSALESEFHQYRLALQQEMHGQTQKREQELLERQSALENQYRGQRERLDRELQNQHKTVDADVSSRVEHERRRLAELSQKKEAVWTREKEELLNEFSELQRRLSAAEAAARLAQTAADQQLAQKDAEKSAHEYENVVLEAGATAWREKVQELSVHSADLVQQLAAAQDEARRHQTREKAWENDLAVVQSDAAAWRAKVEEFSAKAADMARQLAAARNEAREALEDKALEAKQRAMAEERERQLRGEIHATISGWETQQKLLSDALDQRRANLAALESALNQRFKDLQDETSDRNADWLRREESLRKRDIQWHEDLRQWKLRLEDRQAKLEDLKTELSRAIQNYRGRRPPAAGPDEVAA